MMTPPKCILKLKGQSKPKPRPSSNKQPLTSSVPDAPRESVGKGIFISWGSAEEEIHV